MNNYPGDMLESTLLPSISPILPNLPNSASSSSSSSASSSCSSSNRKMSDGSNCSGRFHSPVPSDKSGDSISMRHSSTSSDSSYQCDSGGRDSPSSSGVQRSSTARNKAPREPPAGVSEYQSGGISGTEYQSGGMSNSGHKSPDSRHCHHHKHSCRDHSTSRKQAEECPADPPLSSYHPARISCRSASPRAWPPCQDKEDSVAGDFVPESLSKLLRDSGVFPAAAAATGRESSSSSPPPQPTGVVRGGGACPSPGLRRGPSPACSSSSRGTSPARQQGHHQHAHHHHHHHHHNHHHYTSNHPHQQHQKLPQSMVTMVAKAGELSPTKPPLQKSTAVDVVEIEAKKKMERGISHATGNETLVSAARNVVQLDFSQRTETVSHVSASSSSSCCSSSSTSSSSSSTTSSSSSSHAGGLSSPCPPPDLETPVYTFTLPDLTNFAEDYRGFLEKDLIELSALISLEQSGRLNWWADTGTCQRLWPLATTGDGNCLLHAASLGMWGFHDRLLTLRKALYCFLTSSPAVDAIYRRWRWQSAQQNAQSGLTLTEAEWAEEWNSVIRLASSQPRSQGDGTQHQQQQQQQQQSTRRRSRLSTVSEDGWAENQYNPLYESLEEIHVLVLAHVLRRPIIIVADLVLKDAYGEALAPIPFGGIYLPLEFSPSECQKCPLILTYDSGHFSALVPMQPAGHVQSPLPNVIPVTDSNHAILPIQFSVDPGFDIEWGVEERSLYMLSKLNLQEQDKLGLLREYLDVVQVPLPTCFLDPPTQVQDLLSPDSIDSSSQSVCDDSDILGYPKSRTAKQIQSVAKQFGSIGKKLKKNLGSITRLARTGSFKGLRKDVRTVSQTTRLQNCRIVGGHQDHILAALIHTQRCLPYQQEMVNNYLQEAKIRFDKDKELKLLQAEERRERAEQVSLEQQARLRQLALEEGEVTCVNPDCSRLGNASTSYLCSVCYYQQVARERDSPLPQLNPATQSGGTTPAISTAAAPVDAGASSAALYGSGRSQFYVNNDAEAYETAARDIPAARQPNHRNTNNTLFLANSTFYRDRVPDLVVPVPKHNPDPMPIVPVDKPPLVSAGQLLHCDTPKPPTRRKVMPGDNLKDKSSNKPMDYSHSCQEYSRERVGGMKVQLPGLADAQPCYTPGCHFFGSSHTNYYCSKCYRESQRVLPPSRV